MIDKPPKITKEDIAKREIDKIRRILKGELNPDDINNKDGEILPEPPETEEEKERVKPVIRDTWHDRYYGNKDDPN